MSHETLVSQRVILIHSADSPLSSHVNSVNNYKSLRTIDFGQLLKSVS